MKASLISKIILCLCIICLISGFFTIDRHKNYEEENTKTSKNILSHTNKIAVIELDGAIATTADSNFFSKETNASNMLKSLKAAKDDNEIKGIIVKINSPGGTVAMSQNIYNQIIKIRKTKPIIAVLDDVAASGGYYIACAADRIIAQEGTLTGSIGVIFSFMDYHDLLIKKLAVNQVVIKSGKYKDIGSGSREMLPEERKLMQDIIDDSYNQFLDAIRMGRINRNDSYTTEKSLLKEENLVKYADGRVFTGKQAKQLGFVDQTGDMDSAKAIVEKMVQEKYNSKLPVKLIQYNKKYTFNDYFSGMTEYNSGLKLTDILPSSLILSRKPLYLWE